MRTILASLGIAVIVLIFVIYKYMYKSEAFEQSDPEDDRMEVNPDAMIGIGTSSDETVTDYIPTIPTQEDQENSGMVGVGTSSDSIADMYSNLQGLTTADKLIGKFAENDLDMNQDKVPFDLLPSNDVASQFGIETGDGIDLESQNYLNSDHFVGVDTRGTSVKNGTRDIRPLPLAPRTENMMWWESSKEDDLYRKNIF